MCPSLCQQSSDTGRAFFVGARVGSTVTRVWTYPWTVLADDPADAVERIADLGVDGLAVASHYHSIRTLEPRGETGPTVRSFPGGAYFEPGERFADLPLDPPRNEVDADLGPNRDPIGAVTASARAADLDVRAWTVCLHNTRLGRENPRFRVEDAFGHPQDHALCPSNDAVREYYAAVLEALVEHGVDGLDLESIGYPSVRHGHGAAFGHETDHAVTSQAGEWLLSQCFCSACRERMDRLDPAIARDRVRSLCREAMAGPDRSPPDLTTLRRDDRVVSELFAFRADVVTEFVERLAAASGATPLNYYVADGLGRDPRDGWPAGVVLDRIDPHLDRVTALCYTDDPETARRRVRALREFVDVVVDGGVTVDPDVVADRSAFEAVVRETRAGIDGELSVYNHATATETPLEWIGGVA